MKTKLLANLNRGINTIGFQLKKHSPELLLIGGVVGVGVTTVMACKATLKVHDILENAKETIDVIHETAELGEIEAKDGSLMHYTKEDETKDLTRVYVTTGLELAKLYGPSIALGMLSVTSICASNNILRKRNVALAAAYTAVDKGFRDYRDRVVDRFGESVDRELKYDLKAEKIEEIVTDENGKEKKVKTTVEVAGDENVKYFTKTNPNWNANMEYNEMFLEAQTRYADDLFYSRTYFTLNDAYDLYDIPRTKEGMVKGWVHNKHNANGSNHIRISYHKVYLRNEDGLLEPAYALEFDVDGDIYNQM